jgi:hypothetical protein
MVVCGAVIIAGIGFAGSYAAVRDLAIKKGFGDFAYVFPIGIDAGICVLLALDLLLTWIRIPFPLLRQTAWLLTAATIAFNGAAAWPNPLGVGMHAVIPILFVVAIEAARHAIGRIADITADKHMESVRPTRWLLSPIPTFLLWRRMNLWELRSYDQVIKLEQERLVYQARLHSRFGRAWRRKAPVESLMPLRLAKYGIPLIDTATVGPASEAGIEPAPGPGTAAPSVLASVQRQRRGLLATGADSSHAAAQPRNDGPLPTTRPTGEEAAKECAGAYPTQPDAALAASAYGQDGTTTASAPPTTGKTQEALAVDFQERATSTGTASPTAKASADWAAQTPHESVAAKEGLGPIPTHTGAHTTHPTRKKHRPYVKAALDGHSPRTPAEGGDLTLVDRYYLAWREYQTQHGDEPTGQELSAYLADRDMHGRSGKPISPSTLRRYSLPFRLYTIWATHRVHSSTPALDAIAHDCAAHGITAQYNKPLTIHDISEHADDFERRWQSLTHHHANTQQ